MGAHRIFFSSIVLFPYSFILIKEKVFSVGWSNICFETIDTHCALWLSQIMILYPLHVKPEELTASQMPVPYCP